MDERLDYGMDEWVNLFLLHKEEREEREPTQYCRIKVDRPGTHLIWSNQGR
jgi:hypothetical protein